MRRDNLSILALVALAAIVAALWSQGAFGQSPPAGLIAEPLDQFQAIVERGVQPLGRYHIADATPQQRAQLVRWVLGWLPAGQTLKLGALTYDFGLTPLRLPPQVRLKGLGKGLTVLTCSQEDQRHSCGFEISGRNIVLEGLTLVWKPKDDQIRGGQTLGIADPNNPGNTLVTVRDCEVVSYGSCALYYWGGGKGHRGTFVGCDFAAGRWAGCLGAGSGDDSALLDFTSCTFTADFAKYGGAGGDMGTPPNTSGWVSRGGQTTMTDCRFAVTGFAGTGKPNDPNGVPFLYALGVVTGSLGDPALPKWSYKWPYLTLVRPTFAVAANGAKQAIDAWCQSGTLVVDGKTVSPN